VECGELWAVVAILPSILGVMMMKKTKKITEFFKKSIS